MPLVSQTFDQLLDFTRTTAATFVGSNGLIQNTAASRNLLLQTQQLDNAAWGVGATTVTANATVAPDGTSTADKVIATAVAGYHVKNQLITVTSGVSYTLSFYVKAAEYTKVYFCDAQGGRYACSFDLAAGTAGTPTGAYTGKSASITNAGNGWYRCELSFIPNATEATRPSATGYPDTGATLNNFGAQYTGDGTSGIFVWGAQLEAASAATTYTRNNGGVFPPRFDYDPVTLAPKGILIEEQRTNLAQQSADYTTAFWSKTDLSLTTGISDPAGGTSATTITATGAFASVQTAVVGGAAGVTYTSSFWIRRRTGTGQISLRCGDVTNIPITVTSSWARYTATAVASTTTVRLAVVLTTSGDEVDIWGGQIEAGAFATSYIPTVASQVTRTGDFTSIVAPNFAPWYNQSEGSFVVEVSYLNASTTSLAATAYSGDPGTTNDYITYLKTSGAINRQSIVTAGVGQGNLEFAGAVAGTVYKMAGAYKVNDVAFSVNGATALTDATVTLPTPNALAIGFLFTSFLNGHVRSIRYYPTRLSNAQLQALSA